MVAGQVPADVVRDDDRTLAFRDINPQAPTHILVIPKAHYADIAALVAADRDLLAEVISAASAVAEQAGLQEGWRLIFNTGAGAGQTVHHVHGHVLGGRRMTWPPG
jgi:histidine triad (HIT) family protein